MERTWASSCTRGGQKKQVTQKYKTQNTQTTACFWRAEWGGWLFLFFFFESWKETRHINKLKKSHNKSVYYSVISKCCFFFFLMERHHHPEVYSWVQSCATNKCSRGRRAVSTRPKTLLRFLFELSNLHAKSQHVGKWTSNHLGRATSPWRWWKTS